MRTGRPRKPTALKILHGTARKDRANPEEPKLPIVRIPAPKGMKGRALQEWTRLANVLSDAGILTIGDTSAFETYCNLVAEVAAYERLIARVGRENAHSLGYANYLLKLRMQKKQHAETLGLTPSSRAGVKAPGVVKPPKVSDEGFIFGEKSSA